MLHTSCCAVFCSDSVVRFTVPLAGLKYTMIIIKRFDDVCTVCTERFILHARVEKVATTGSESFVLVPEVRISALVFV